MAQPYVNGIEFFLPPDRPKVMGIAFFTSADKPQVKGVEFFMTAQGVVTPPYKCFERFPKTSNQTREARFFTPR